MEHKVESPAHSASMNGEGIHEEFPTVIPPEHPYRTLVLCFDGTGDQFDLDNSNIVEFFSMLKKDDRNKQMVFYQAGIGTWTSPEIATPMAATISKTLDEAFAWNLDAHVMGGYEFLMQNYVSGDRICLFGFSRGAYTARSLAGMIHKVGLLPACNHQQVPFAYKMFTQDDEQGWEQSNVFKSTFSVSVDIEFVGVWDTVNSVGLVPRRLPFTTSNTIVRTARHAISLDERRVKFKSNHWVRPTKAEQLLSVSDQKIHKEKQAGHKPRRQGTLKSFEKKYAKDHTQPTDIDEVWFVGCHSDVGGGSVSSRTKHTLARIPLRWMIRECFKTHTGIMFKSSGLRRVGLDPATLYPDVLPRPPALPMDKTCVIRPIPKDPPPPISTLGAVDNGTGSGGGAVGERHMTEEEWDREDILSPMYDQLDILPVWWVLEYLPLKKQKHKEDPEGGGGVLGLGVGTAAAAAAATAVGGVGGAVYVMNKAQPRKIPKPRKCGIRFHRSVKARMEAAHEDGSPYVPKPTFSLDNVEWVD